MGIAFKRVFRGSAQPSGEKKKRSQEKEPRDGRYKANLYHRGVDVGANQTGFWNPPFFKGMQAPVRS